MDQRQYLTTRLGHEQITVPILNTFKEQIVIFDIGSCDGLDSLRYNTIFANTTIHAFEANEPNFQQLKINTGQFENIITNNVALSNTSGRLPFYNSSRDDTSNEVNWDHGNKSGSLLPPKEHLNLFRNIKFSSPSEVKAITLNDYCQSNQIGKVHLMHIDVQGAEKMVLEGGDSILKNTVFVWLEASNIELYKDQPLKNQLIAMLKHHNFSCILDHAGKKNYGDLLFFNKNFKPSILKKHLLLLYKKKLLNGLFSK